MKMVSTCFFEHHIRSTQSDGLTAILGHEICSHTWSHSALTTLTNEQIIAEIRWTEKAIRDVIGVTPRYLRPPYGDIDDRVRAVVEAAGYRILHWNLDSFDWQISESLTTSPHENIIAQNLYKKLSSNTSRVNELSEVKYRTEQGFIVLAHDVRKEVVDRWIEALKLLKKFNYRIEPVSKCLPDEEPYLETLHKLAEGSSQDSGSSTTPSRMVLGTLHFSLWIPYLINLLSTLI
jgi:peptidoglycan/xylan/chitin deacetylase (PgdA/CDA1 family)